MTAEDLRQLYQDGPYSKFRGAYIGNDTCLQLILLEIAAQLAEVNERNAKAQGLAEKVDLKRLAIMERAEKEFEK